MSIEPKKIVAEVLAGLATAALVALAAIVIYEPHDNTKDIAFVHKDLARVEARLDRIETLLLERK